MNIDAMLAAVQVPVHSNIRIAGGAGGIGPVCYFDVFKQKRESHDADIVFVTHDHYDHYDEDSIARVAKPETVIVVPESLQKAAKKAFRKNKLVVCKPDDSFDIAGVQVDVVPAYNTGKLFHPKKNAWVGYLVTLPVDGVGDDGSAAPVCYYVAGDTDANPELAELASDVALVPVGGKFTMDAAEAASLVNRMEPLAAVPTHYGSVTGKSGDGKAFASAVNRSIRVQIKL